MDKKEKISKEFESLKKDSPYKVPDGYFESFNSRLMDKIHRGKTQPWYKLVIQKARPQVAFVFSFAALALLVFTLAKLFIGEPKIQELSHEEIASILEEDAYYLDENELFALVNETESNSIIDEENELTEDDIIQYLISEGDNLDLLIEQF